MKSKLRKLVLVPLLAGALSGCGRISLSYDSCGDEPNSKLVDSRLPEVYDYQQLVLNPSYLSGKSDLSYTLLADTDSDGEWNVAQNVRFLGDSTSVKRYFVNKGDMPYMQSPVLDNTEFVEPEFFEMFE